MSDCGGTCVERVRGAGVCVRCENRTSSRTTSGTLETQTAFPFENFLLMRVGSTHLHVFTHLQSCTIINRGMRMGSPAPHHMHDHMTGLEDGTCTHT